MLSNKSPAIFFQTFISSLLGYIALFFINRYIGPVYWGYLSYALAFGALFSLVTDLGFNTTYVKFISGKGDTAEDMGAYLVIKVVLNVIYVAVVLGSLLFWTDVLKRGFQNPIEYWTIIAVIPYYTILNIMPVFNNYYKANMQSYNIAMPRLIESVFRNSIFIGIGVLYYLHIEGSLRAGITVILALLYSISYFIYIILLWLHGHPWGFKKPAVETIKKYIKFAIPLAFATSIGIVNGNIDKIIVQFFWGAVATGALYTDQRLISIIATLTGPVTIFLLPLLMRNLEDTKEIQNTKIMEYERILSLISAPFAMILFFLSPFILNIYNARYLMYASSLSIIAVGGYVGALTYPFSSSIISKGKQHMVAWISLSGIILNIILNVILIPTTILGFRLGSLGVEGATISYTAANFLVYFLYKEYFRKINETRTRSTAVIHIVVAFPSALVLLLSAIYLKPYSFIVLFPVILLSLLLYLIMSLSLKEITTGQIKMLIRNLIPRKDQ